MIKLVLEALTPVSHGDTRTGISNATNTRLFMTQPILLNGRRAYAPHVSENALRHSLFREPLADHLVEALGLAGDDDSGGVLSRSIQGLLYSGGAMGGAGRLQPGEESVIGHRVARLYPSLALLGGAIDAMSDADRRDFIDEAFAVIWRETGIDPADIIAEAKRRSQMRRAA